MGSSDIKGLLTCFSPSLDFLAISAGDGRIKVWDTIKGQLQTEFSDLAGDDESNVLLKSERGHLSIDYTCMKWLSLERKKKRKLGTSLLVLGTGGGDVLALDVSAGQLKWKISDCHPGGVSAVSSSNQGSSIYTSGADGMVCEIDPISGNQINKFKASTKTVSSLSVSPDGRAIATAAAQLKVFDSSDLKKIQKFSGHPGAVRGMIWTEDGKFVLSCAAGERYVAIWRVDRGKKQSSSCILAMEHPAVYLDCKCVGKGEDGRAFYVLAISETGMCYFWYGKNIVELHKSKPARISVSLDDLKNNKGTLPAIFAAKIQNSASPDSAHVFIVHGLQIRPTFEKIVVNHGDDLKLNRSIEGVFLPLSRSQKSKKQQNLQSGATALDRANAEDALLPIPKVLDLLDRKKKDLASKPISDRDQPMQEKDDFEGDTATCCIEDKLRKMGILNAENTKKQKSKLSSPSFANVDLEAVVPEKKMRAAVLSMEPSEASKLFTSLLSLWQSRACSGKYVLPWICCLLVNHSQAIITEEHGSSLVESLYKVSKSRGGAVQSLLQLSGRLQLVTAQIDKASQFGSPGIAEDNKELESDEDEDEEDDDVDEVVFGEESDTSSQEDDA